MFKKLRSWYFKKIAINPPCPKCGHGIMYHIGGLGYRGRFFSPAMHMLEAYALLDYSEMKNTCSWHKDIPEFETVNGLKRVKQVQTMTCNCDLHASEVYLNL